MSLQRKINGRIIGKPNIHLQVDKFCDGLKPDKGLENGSCNRTACQAPLIQEVEHQFMDGNFTGKGRLFYCRHCARDFDRWDKQSGDPIRIKREFKVQQA